MNAIKAAVRLLYVALRFVFRPIIFAFRPIGASRQAIVVTSTMAVLVFVIQPIVTAKLGAGWAVGFTGAGALLGYLLLVWGKEFESV